MNEDSDLIDLYSGRILELAADIPLTERLDSPQATVKRLSPLCGSTVTIDLSIRDGRVSAYGQEVKACTLGQAAASVVGRNIIGRTRTEIENARDQLMAMLISGGPVPDAPFEELEILIPARNYRNRHASIMLAIEAAAEGMANAEEASCA